MGAQASNHLRGDNNFLVASAVIASVGFAGFAAVVLRFLHQKYYGIPADESSVCVWAAECDAETTSGESTSVVLGESNDAKQGQKNPRMPQTVEEHGFRTGKWEKAHQAVPTTPTSPLGKTPKSSRSSPESSQGWATHTKSRVKFKCAIDHQDSPSTVQPQANVHEFKNGQWVPKY